MGGNDDEFDTLKNLTAFLTLSKAEEKGFKPSDYNLSDQEAGSIATVFSRYDTNDDMMLEQSEVNRLLCAPRCTATPPEGHGSSSHALPSRWTRCLPQQQHMACRLWRGNTAGCKGA